MGSRLRILSANLLNGAAVPSALAEVVEAWEVDVAALQEVSPEQAEALVPLLPFGAWFPGRDYNGMGIALRQPASEGRVSLPRRDALVARLDPGTWTSLAGPIEIVNVHVSAPHAWPPWRIPGERRRQLRTLLAHLERTQGCRQVVVGDFNATPRWPLYRRIAARRSDAARLDAEQRGERPRPTWGPWPGGPRLLRIDHAFVQGVRVEAVRVVRIRGSDHSGVVLEIQG